MKVSTNTFAVKLYIANEFGLFRRDLIKDIAKYKVECVAFEAYTEKSLLNVSSLLSKEEGGFSESGRILLTFHLDTSEKRNSLHGKYLEFRIKDNDDVLSIITPWKLVVIPNGDDDYYLENNQAITCIRAVKIDDSRDRVLVGEVSDLGIAGKLWDGAICLTNFLFSNQMENWYLLSKDLSQRQNSVFVELGCGTGMLSLAFVKKLQSHFIVATDLPEVISLIQFNKQINAISDKQMDVKILNWGVTPKRDLGIDDRGSEIILIMSDVVYEPAFYLPLVTSIVEIAPKGVLISHRHRNPKDEEFFTLLIDALKCKIKVLKRGNAQWRRDWKILHHFQEDDQYNVEFENKMLLSDVSIFLILL